MPFDRRKRKLDAALNSLPGTFFVLYEQGEVIRWNDQATEVFGLTHKEIEGRSAEEFVQEDDKERLRKEIKRVFKEGYTRAEFKIQTAEDDREDNAEMVYSVKNLLLIFDTFCQFPGSTPSARSALIIKSILTPSSPSSIFALYIEILEYFPISGSLALYLINDEKIPVIYYT